MSAQKALEKLCKQVNLRFYLAPCEAEAIEKACKDKPKTVSKPKVSVKKDD